jgi:glycosyltransferase involved in cell wall biosynthesis
MRSERPLVSVLMPVRNVKDAYLTLSIESILSQTYKDIEFIIVDDGSTDDTQEIVNRYAAKDPRICLLVNETNIGPGASANKAIRVAKGKYIARQDGDDISMPERISRQVEYLETHPHIDLLATRAMQIDQFGRRMSATPFPDNTELISYRLIAGDNCLAQPSIMFRNQLGLFYRDKFYYSEDYDFYLRVLINNRSIACLNEVFLCCRYPTDEPFARYSRRFFYVLFRELAKKYYEMHIKNGQDSYAQFETQDIMGINVETTTEKEHLSLLIRIAIGGNYLPEARRIIKRYIRTHGFHPMYVMLWLSTFIGRHAHQRLRRLVKRGQVYAPWH